MPDFRYQELFTHANPGDRRFRRLAAEKRDRWEAFQWPSLRGVA